MTTVHPAVTEKYNLGPVQPWVNNAAYLIGPQFNIKTIGGWRRTDPFPDHPSGHALDFMTPNKTTGDNLANYVVANANNLGVKYVIWWHRVWTPSQGWHPYTSTSNPHTDHVHVTFTNQPAAWTGGAGAPDNMVLASYSQSTDTENTDETCAWGITLPSLGPIGGGNMCILSKVQVRAIIGGMLYFSGILIGIVGIALLMRYGLDKTRTGNAALNAIPGTGAIRRPE